MTSPVIPIILGLVISQSISVEPSPQFRTLGRYPVGLRPLVAEGIGDPAACRSLAMGGGRFVVMYPGPVEGRGPEVGDGPGVYTVDVGKKTVEGLVSGRPTWLRIVQDKIDVTWLLMTAETREGHLVSNQYYALVLRRVARPAAGDDRVVDPDSGVVNTPTEMEVGVSRLVMERYVGSKDGEVDIELARDAGLATEVRVSGYHIGDLNGDGYPDIKIDVVEKDVESGDTVQRSMDFVYSDGALVGR